MHDIQQTLVSTRESHALAMCEIVIDSGGPVWKAGYVDL